MAILDVIMRLDSSANEQKAQDLAEVWQGVVEAIIKEMLLVSQSEVEEIHIDLREEMALEIARLTAFLSEKVVGERLAERKVEQIKQQEEITECFSDNGKERISNTAKVCADNIWIKKYHERWLPKTKAMFEREREPKRTVLKPKKVDDNHFIPKSFIRRYWSEGQWAFKNVKTRSGLIEQKKIPLGNWGFRKNLYSDHLEAYFSLLEGDAVRPIEMLLNVQPLNRSQREAFVGFVVMQRLRNPEFMSTFKESMKLKLFEMESDESDLCAPSIDNLYESLFRDHALYDELARPILLSRWVVIRSETEKFILPDVCHVSGSYSGKTYVVMPLTPKDCLVVMPITVEEPRIVPNYIQALECLQKDITQVLLNASQKEFLSASDIIVSDTGEATEEAIHRIITCISDELTD